MARALQSLGAAMTPYQLAQARQALGWSVTRLANALRLRDGGPRRVRAMESGDNPISGPVSVAVEAYLDGWRPRDGS